jgi:hypothetical protein
MATKLRKKAVKRRGPTLANDGNVSVTLSFPMPILIRLINGLTKNLGNPQLHTYLRDIDEQLKRKPRKKKGVRAGDGTLN